MAARSRKPEPNLAYHLIQSFAPGEVTGEEAHAISQELADRLLQGKYPYVLATHINRDHVHSHLIFCSVNNQDYKKYHRCTQSYNQIRKLSDEICAEHGKSVIKETTRTGKTYAEWMHKRKGDSWKATIKKDIDDCILISRSYEEFLQRMRDKGYVCNGCSDRHGGCTLEKRYYYADSAHKEYLETFSESRAGLSLSEEDVRHLDEIISPLVKQSQSPHHICVTNKDSIMVSESTISY